MANGAATGAATGAEWRSGTGVAAWAAPNAPFPPAKPGGNGARPPRRVPAAVRPTDAANDAIDAALVTARLEEAGRTLLALPHSGPSTKLRVSVLEVLRDAVEGEDQNARLRPAMPRGAQVSRMDEALGWLSRIPADRYVLRRIVGARALVHPTTDRHLYPWRKLGTALGADHKAIQRWHAQGIALIVASLNAG